MPSPVTMPALVLKRNSRPAPPVASTTALARNSSSSPVATCRAMTPTTAPSCTAGPARSTRRSVRSRGISARSGTACAAYGSRSCRQQTRCAPFSCHQSGAPVCGHRAGGSEGTPSAPSAPAPGRRGARSSPPLPAPPASRPRKPCRRSAPETNPRHWSPPPPPSAATVWERMGYTLDTSAMRCA